MNEIIKKLLNIKNFGKTIIVITLNPSGEETNMALIL